MHKFGRAGGRGADDDNGEGTKAFIEALQKLPADFLAKGELYVFVDECHRTQSGDLHQAMKALLPKHQFSEVTQGPVSDVHEARGATYGAT